MQRHFTILAILVALFLAPAVAGASANALHGKKWQLQSVTKNKKPLAIPKGLVQVMQFDATKGTWSLTTAMTRNGKTQSMKLDGKFSVKGDQITTVATINGKTKSDTSTFAVSGDTVTFTDKNGDVTILKAVQ